MKDLTEIQNKIKIDSIEKLEFTDEQILENFFIENKIDSYTEKFKNEKVFSAELLKDLTDEDLLKLGVATLGDRKRMLKLFQGNELNNFHMYTLPATFSGIRITVCTSLGNFFLLFFHKQHSAQFPVEEESAPNTRYKLS